MRPLTEDYWNRQGSYSRNTDIARIREPLRSLSAARLRLHFWERLVSYLENWNRQIFYSIKCDIHGIIRQRAEDWAHSDEHTTRNWGLSCLDGRWGASASVRTQAFAARSFRGVGATIPAAGPGESSAGTAGRLDRSSARPTAFHLPLSSQRGGSFLAD